MTEFLELLYSELTFKTLLILNLTKLMNTIWCNQRYVNHHTHMCLLNVPFPNHRHKYATSTLHGWLSTRFWIVVVSIYALSATRALMRSHTDIRWEGLMCSQCFKLSQMLSVGLKSHCSVQTTWVLLHQPCKTVSSWAAYKDIHIWVWWSGFQNHFSHVVQYTTVLFYVRDYFSIIACLSKQPPQGEWPNSKTVHYYNICIVNININTPY